MSARDSFSGMELGWSVRENELKLGNQVVVAYLVLFLLILLKLFPKSIPENRKMVQVFATV